MTARSILPAISVLLTSSAATQAATPMTFDTADSVKSWTFSNGPEFPGATGRIEWDAGNGHDKAGCLRLSFSFEGGGNYIQAGCLLPRENDFKTARLWLKKPAGNRVTFRGIDSSSQTFQKSVDFSFDDWQQFELDLTRWTSSFGGANDQKVHWPMRGFAVLIENTATGKEGSLLVDDLSFAADAPSPTETVTAYTAWNQHSSIGFRADGGPGNAFDKGTWNYTFSGQSSPSIHTEFSLLGRPAGMKLFFESDASGHEVVVTLGSHFQNFRKQVGRLTEKGPQIIDVPLGNLEGWEYFGGENNGQPQFPLRITQIALKRTEGGPEKGTIRLERIDAQTPLPADQKVVLLPDVKQTGNRTLFKVEIQNLRKTQAQGELVGRFRMGNGVDSDIRKVTLPANGAAPTIIELEPRAIGNFNVVEGTFWWVEGDSISSPASIGASTVPTEAGSTALDPSSPFGVGLYLYRWHGHPQAKEKMNELATLARHAGVKWTREEIDWHRTEPKKGEFDWKFYDDLVDVAHANGISIYGLLCYWSYYSQKDTPEGVEEYCQWTRQVVRRYKDRIKHWEIWNEPNIFFWSGPKELYFSMLAKAYDAIKAEDPEAQVLGCSTAGIDVDFIKQAMAAGANFDALTIHPYRGELNDLQFIKELRDVKELVGGRPVWITEMGWPSDRFGGTTERRQASFVARTYLTSVAGGAVANVSWYDFRNDGNDPYYNEFNFGMVRNDLRPKPAYQALATIANTLAGMKVTEHIDLGPDAYAFRFSDGKRDVVAACAPQAGRLLAWRGEQHPTVINTFGEKAACVAAEGLSITTLESGMPVYIRGQAGFEFQPAELPIKLSVDRSTVRPGQTVTIRVEPKASVAPSSIWLPLWDEPAPAPDAEGTYHLTIPKGAAPGDTELMLEIGWNKLHLLWPLKLSVQPNVLRV
ncbi:MAG TPA: beta-galactosidase [Phycisphaerae bacterium]|nr:beta-galactosidase [Phycisphaerae bacterium]HRR86207.1 beta-galactosidase [Phycisphaerae bacterium]